MEEWERLLNDLRAELVLREQELELLHEIDLRLLATEQPPQELFKFVVQRTQRLLQANHTTILLRRSTFLEPMYSNLKSVVGQRVPISESLTGMCLETEKPVRVPDLMEEPYGAKYAPLRGYRGTRMRSLLATPIQLRGATIGVLNAEGRRVNAFAPVHERVAQAIAAQIAIALHRTQTVDSNVLFADLDRLLFSEADTQEIIQTALERVMAELVRLEHVEHSGAQIMLLRENGLEIVNSTNPPDVGLIVPVGSSVSGRAVRSRRTVNVGDVSEDREYQRMLGDSIRSEIAVPIVMGEDNDIVIGVLNVESEDRDAFYGFYQVVLESFAEKVKGLLAFVKLRADVVEALELSSANDLLVAVGDQTSHLIHRLNNTVGAMRMRILELQEMQSGKQLDEHFLEESLTAMLTLADRTLRMPDDITGILGQGGSTVDVNECVRNAMKHITVPEGVRLDCDLEDGMPRLQLYCFDIVVQNLLQNAIDAMPDGGRLSVTTSVISRPNLVGYVYLAVKDTGTGIPADLQKRVFELNFTTKGENKRGKGLGLGLWWVRNFVRRARGDITIQSGPNRGTEVTVKIPVDHPGILEEPAAAGSAQ